MIFQACEKPERDAIPQADGRDEISIRQLICTITYSGPWEWAVALTDTTPKRESGSYEA